MERRERMLLAGNHTAEDIAAYFEDAVGYRVERTEDGSMALQQMTDLPSYDIVLLDVRLAKKNGFDVLREARRAGVTSPVILLSSNHSASDSVQGFDLGADDYVALPVSMEELKARVKAVLRRSRPGGGARMQVYRVGEVMIDLENECVTRHDAPVPFTGLEFDILRYLVAHRGRTVSRKQMLRDIWGISGDVTTRTIDRHVAAIRKKIEANPQQPRYIETVYGIGYKLVS